MPNIFTNGFNGEQRYYVSRVESETVVARTVVDFGVKDSKGRAVAASRYIKREIVILEEGEHRPSNCRLHKIDAPTDYFVGVSIHLRNGKPFGGSWIHVEGTDLAEVAKELDARIERARRTAVKKHA